MKNYIWYPDIFFLRVFLLDLMAYLTALLILKKRFQPGICMLIAAVSAFVETGLFWMMHRYLLYRILMLLVVNSVSTICLLRGKKWSLWVRGYLVISVLLLVCGGLLNFWFGLFPHLQDSWIWYVGMGMLSACLCIYGWRKKKEQDLSFRVELEYEGCRTELQGFLDTGNCLRDPYTGSPVSVVPSIVLERAAAIPVEKIRYIPYHTVGQSGQLLRVFTADKMCVYQSGEKREYTRPVIGLAEDKVFCNDQIQILLNREFL